MQIYSYDRRRRAGQVVSDVVALCAIVVAIVAGVLVSAAIRTVSALGIAVEDAGSGFASTMSAAAANLGSVPLLGSGIGAPFASASDAGGTLSAAGRDLQTAVNTTATVIGTTITLVALVVIALAWLIPRLRFIRNARLTRALLDRPGGPELLAIRAIATQPLGTLSRASDDLALGAVFSNPATVRRLVRIQLESAGIDPTRSR